MSDLYDKNLSKDSYKISIYKEELIWGSLQ